MYLNNPSQKKHVSFRYNGELIRDLMVKKGWTRTRVMTHAMNKFYSEEFGTPLHELESVEFEDEHDGLESDKIDFDAIEDEPSPE